LGVSVSSVCRRTGMSRQNYYARRRQRRREEVDAELVEQLVLQERRVQPRIGTRKLHRVLAPELAEAGVPVGRDRLFEILRERGLLLEPRRAAYPHTTQFNAYLPTYSNLISKLDLNGPNQVYVSDLTYLRSEEGFLYLALITDKWSRKIVGHHCADSLEAQGCLCALDMALDELPAAAHPIHHSDRGCQYCCHQYVQRLTEKGLGISMTEANHCAENALAERVNGILKGEYALDQEFRTKAQTRRATAQAIHIYNTRRLHTALNYRTPALVHAGAV
jgi:putative transposase